MSFHSELIGPQEIHVPHDFEYADEAARLAATGFVTGDLKKLALQLDDFSLWMLTATTPTWSEITSTGSNTLAEILAGGNTSGGSDLLMSDGDTLDLQGNTSAMILNRLTTVERDALTPVQGMKIFNSTTSEDQTYNGSMWVAPTAGSGDVVGPGSSTSEAVARFDSTSGKLIQNSVAILDNSGNLSGINDISLAGLADGRDIATDGIKLDGIKALSDVTGPASAVDDQVAAFDGITGKLIKDSGVPVSTLGDVTGPASATDNALARFDGITGKLIQDSNGVLDDAGVLTIVGAITSETRKVSTNPAIIVEIFSGTDFDALATAGVITVTAGTELILRVKASSFTTASRFDIEAGASLTIIGNRLSAITYSGALTFFTGTTSSVRLNAIQLIASGGGTLFSIASLDPLSAQITVDRCQLLGWNLGSIDRAFILFTFATIQNWDSGLTVTNVRLFGTTGLLFGQLDEVAVTDSLFKINTHDPKAVVNLHFSTGRLPAGDFYVHIDPAFHNDGKIIIDSSVVVGDMFDTSGITGVFTAVADATIAATTINTVSDSLSTPGIARFNFTVGPTVFVNQYVEVSGFIINTDYNQNGLVTAAGVGWFEVEPVLFGATEIGSFRSDSVTLTETTTTASDGLGMTIDTTDDTNYDGGAIAYNKLANSFEIHRVWDTTESGTWSAAGLNQTDPRVIAQGNPGQADSHEIASAYVNGNITVNPTIINTVYTDMAFGTAGAALVDGSNMERWKLIDDVVGIFEYTGNEPFDGEIVFSQTSTSAGGAVEFRWKWVHDLGAGYVDLLDPVISSNDIGASAGNTSFIVPLSAVMGDRIKPQVTRMAGASTITVTFASISVQ